MRSNAFVIIFSFCLGSDRERERKQKQKEYSFFRFPDEHFLVIFSSVISVMSSSIGHLCYCFVGRLYWTRAWENINAHVMCMVQLHTHTHSQWKTVCFEFVEKKYWKNCCDREHISPFQCTIQNRCLPSDSLVNSIRFEIDSFKFKWNPIRLLSFFGERKKDEIEKCESTLFLCHLEVKTSIRIDR